MIPEESDVPKSRASRELVVTLIVMSLALFFFAAAVVYFDLYEPPPEIRQVWEVIALILTSNSLWILIGFVIIEFLLPKHAPQKSQTVETLGIPGGQDAALRWVFATLLASGACGGVFWAVTKVYPEFGELFEEIAFIVMSLCVAYAQQLSVSKQIARKARFWQKTFWYSVISLGVLYTSLALYNEHSQTRFESGIAEFGAILAAVLFPSLLGWQQGGQLASDRKKRVKWSVATGLGASLATYGTINLAKLADPYLLQIKATDYPFMFQNQGWIASTVKDSLMWLGIACAQAFVIYRSPPVRDVDEHF